MNKKNIIIMSCVTLLLISLAGVTYAAFRKGVRSNVTATGGEIKLVVNGADVIQNEVFEVVLQRSETQQFIIPGDSGYFDLTLDSTGSHDDVDATVTISRTGLPDNLKFYVDEEYKKEYVDVNYVVKRTTPKNVRIYWYWADIDDENDSLFIGKTITANVVVVAKMSNKNTLYNELASKNPTLDTNVDFAEIPSETNGQGLMMRDGTQNDEYPIMYYRGIDTSVVTYGGFCWLVVRTTETGGVKLIYNGEITEQGTCKDYSGVAMKDGDEALLGEDNFNPSNASPVYLGYMYNDNELYFSSDVLDSAGYKTYLDNNQVDQATGRHIQNLKDSTVKGVLDTWYAENIDGKQHESLLEDTVWCNDRSTSDTVYSIDNYNNGYPIPGVDGDFRLKWFLYNSMLNKTLANGWNGQLSMDIIDLTLLSDDIYLSCPRNIDKFTVDSANGNGDLTYPIGLLTMPEVLLSGVSMEISECDSSLISYLELRISFSTMTPAMFWLGESFAFSVLESCYEYRFGGGVRPVISLKNNTVIISGSGTYSDPYVVD